MRITPIGIATPPDVTALVDATVEASRLTHGTSVALAGAAAVAGAVSAGVSGAPLDDAVRLALECARAAAVRGRWVAGADVATRIAWAVQVVAGLSDDVLLDTLATLVGTSLATQESVPAAFALAVARADDPWHALRLAASVGGDTDTIAAMTGAILGAVRGESAFPAAMRARLLPDPDPTLAPLTLADGLLALRAHRLLCPEPVGPAAGSPGAAPSGAAPAQAGRMVYVGQAVVDLVSAVPQWPGRGGDVLAGPAVARVGGGAIVLLAAARAGLHVVYAGRHGTGPRGDLVRAALHDAGVVLLLGPTAEQDTGTVLVGVEPDGERTFVTTPGAEAGLTAAELAACRPAPRDVVVVSGYALAHAANRAAVLAWLPGLDPATTLLVDPGPLVADVPAAARAVVWARADWLTANAAEAARLTGQADPARAASSLAASARGRALVRVGADGCWLALPDAPPHHVPAPRVAVRDLTGAGDVHTAVFVAGLLHGLPAADAAARATVAAARFVSGHQR